MKKIQVIWVLLPWVLLSGCFTSRINYAKMSYIQRGMSAKEVIAILGKPSYRSFDDKSEMLEFRNNEYSTSEVVKVWFVDNKVVEMKSYLDKYDDGCSRHTKTEESDEKEKKDSGKSTTAKVRVTTDGKHIVQTGKLIVTPDGKHEMVVSDAGGVIITASGKCFYVL